MTQASRILVALLAGLFAGIALAALAPAAVPGATAVAEPVGTAWLHALQMTIVPLVVALLVTGVAATAEAARAGRLAGRAIALYVTLLAVSAGIAALLTPLILSIVPLPAASADALRRALSTAEAIPPVAPLGEFFAGIVPTNIVKAAAENSFLSIIIFTLIFAFAIARIGAEERALLTRFFTALRDAMLVVIDWVLWIAPVGVFALALVVGARAGTGAFGALVHYILVVSGVGVAVTLIAYPLALLGARLRLADFARAALPAQAVAISTQSSLASLPAMVEGSRTLGVPVATAGVTLPLAVAIFRATGPAMNLAVAIYVATWFGVPLSPATLAVGVVVATLTSLGSVSLPGTVSYVSAIAPIAGTIGAPLAPLGLLVAVETIPDIVRTVGNVTMDIATTAFLSRRGARLEDDAAPPPDLPADAGGA
ncbi:MULTISPECIES: dicarboxylate/amino acid:cation symporter [Sphingomonas]|uniref:Sodium:dicarboxylate symporter n=2 Tax=Sphingomonas adhaesiva TaxID=28212 RepID=A0A2A4I8P0_9SPHN|nr:MULTISPECIES: cation:dicarboxylase symporter family transporter [Sphingomonas]PCG14498.1 sodium:dicarboxylate symporter [Sphingomonas adhaesiva]PZU80141.1 MAG: sodium:dicarboxylate symporter [Sphingomonas sp.]